MSQKGKFGRAYAGLLMAVLALSLTPSGVAHRSIRHNRMGFGGMIGGISPYAGTPTVTGGPNPQLGGGTSNTPSIIPSGTGVGATPSGGAVPYYLQSQRLTTAGAALTPNVPNMYLVDVAAQGGSNPTAWQFFYTPSSAAIFLAGASGMDSTGLIAPGPKVVHYPVNFNLVGTNIPATSNTVLGTATVACGYNLTFSTVSFNGPDISVYRAMFNSHNVTSATAVTDTITFDSGSGVARACIAVVHGLATATTYPHGYIQPPAQGAYQQQIECQGSWNLLVLVPVQPSTATPSFTATSKVDSGLGGSTNVILVSVWFY